MSHLMKTISVRVLLPLALILTSAAIAFSQTPSETPPPPADPPTLKLPIVDTMRLPNGLNVVVVRRAGIPLVTASLLVRRGASIEDSKKAGTASMTADLLTKGTAGYDATEIAQNMEFLGATFYTGAGWNSSSATLNVMKDKLPRALSIMSNTVVRPTFPQKEVALYKKQALDRFSVALSQPGTLLDYTAASYSFGEHPTGGTPASTSAMTRNDLVKFHNENYKPENSVLIFTGDITSKEAFSMARLFFGGWQGAGAEIKNEVERTPTLTERPPTVKRILVVDLPKSGQAAVGFANRLSTGRLINKNEYFAATVLNSVLGGGYSARLNQEIRLKRGLSYGARSGFDWRGMDSNFLATAQTKNESAGEVAELMKIEIEKLINDDIGADEMTPRKAVVTGGFGRSLQTNNGLAGQLGSLYALGLDASELEAFMTDVSKVSGAGIKNFAGNYLSGGDMIIVGDSSVFLDDLKTRFPGFEIEVRKSGAGESGAKRKKK